MLLALPRQIQELAEAAFRLFMENPNHPSLRHKKLEDSDKGQHKAGSWSVRINRSYRAIYVVVDDVNLWYWIGSHGDYNHFVGSN